MSTSQPDHNLPDFITRLIVEKTTLAGNVEKLEAFLQRDKIDVITAIKTNIKDTNRAFTAEDLLHQQLLVMKSYLKILTERLEIYKQEGFVF